MEDRVFVLEGMVFIVFKYSKVIDVVKYFFLFKKLKKVILMEIKKEV